MLKERRPYVQQSIPFNHGFTINRFRRVYPGLSPAQSMLKEFLVQDRHIIIQDFMENRVHYPVTLSNLDLSGLGLTVSCPSTFDLSISSSKLLSDMKHAYAVPV